MDSELEFSGDNEQHRAGPEMYNNNTSEDDMLVTARSQMLSAGFNRFNMEERVSSSSRSVLIHESSSTPRADKSPSHIIISGDYTEVDNDSPIHRTNQFDNCHLYMYSSNARGVKFKNSGNYAPRVTRLSYSL